MEEKISCLDIIVYMFVSLARLCVVYVVKGIASFLGAWSINV